MFFNLTDNCSQYCQVFLSLSFDEDLGRSLKEDKKNKVKYKKNKKRKNIEEPNPLPGHDKKRSKREQMSKMQEEVFFISKLFTQLQNLVVPSFFN